MSKVMQRDEKRILATGKAEGVSQTKVKKRD